MIAQEKADSTQTHLEFWEFPSGTGHNCVVQVNITRSETIKKLPGNLLFAYFPQTIFLII